MDEVSKEFFSLIEEFALRSMNRSKGKTYEQAIGEILGGLIGSHLTVEDKYEFLKSLKKEMEDEFICNFDPGFDTEDSLNFDPLWGLELEASDN